MANVVLGQLEHNSRYVSAFELFRRRVQALSAHHHSALSFPGILEALTIGMVGKSDGCCCQISTNPIAAGGNLAKSAIVLRHHPDKTHGRLHRRQNYFLAGFKGH